MLKMSRSPLPALFASVVVASALLSCHSLNAQPPGFDKVKKEAPQAKFTAELVRSSAKDGNEFLLKVTAKIPMGFHIYAMTQSPLAGQPTKIALDRIKGLEAVGEFKSDREPETQPGIEGETLEIFHKQVVWSRSFKLKAGVDPAEVKIDGTVTYMICTTPEPGVEEGACIPGKPTKFSVVLSESGGKPEDSTGDIVPAQTKDPGTVYEHRKSKGSGPILATWKATVQPRQVQPGDTVTLTIEAEVREGWHTYSANQGGITDEGVEQGPQKTGIMFEFGVLKPAGPFKGTKPKPHDSKTWKGLKELALDGKIQWSRTYTVPKDAKPGSIPLTGGISYQICSLRECISHGVAFSGQVLVGSASIKEPLLLKATAAESALQFLEAPEPVDDSHKDAEPAAPREKAPGEKAPGAKNSGTTRASAAEPDLKGFGRHRRRTIVAVSQFAPRVERRSRIERRRNVIRRS